MEAKPALYLVPTPLFDQASPERELPPATIEAVRGLSRFVVENEKSAYRFLSKVLGPERLGRSSLSILDEHTPAAAVPGLLSPLRDGFSLGVLSEAGCPGVADPGAALARAAHDEGFPVVPLPGPSSIIMALMASGLNGQAFRFNGYLPREAADRIKALRRLERAAMESGETQIFIETPYRNKAMVADMPKALRPGTRICLAWDLTGPGAGVLSIAVKDLAAARVLPGKVPCVFLIGA
jgi:16S rRNA (cytidine1402-2'-O)-methyltransferase